MCVFFFFNFLTLKDLGGTTHIHIYVYDTEYDGKGKAQIPPPPKKKKIIKIECEITHWNQLRLTIKMTKTQKLPESGSAPWTPARPLGHVGQTPGPHPLVRGYESYQAPQRSKSYTCNYPYFEIKISTIKVRKHAWWLVDRKVQGVS